MCVIDIIYTYIYYVANLNIRYRNNKIVQVRCTSGYWYLYLMQFIPVGVFLFRIAFVRQDKRIVYASRAAKSMIIKWLGRTRISSAYYSSSSKKQMSF